MWNPFKKKVVVNKIEPDFADVSHWEKVDFEKYDKKILITKATEAESYIDPTFKGIKNKCKEKGITFGAYHFFRCNKDAVIQAQHFLKVSGNTDMPPILDIETLDGESRETCKKKIQIFLDIIEKATGKTPIIYIGHSFAVELKLDESFSRYPLWLARYTTTEPIPPKPWSNYWAWQYADNAPFDGVGECDGNIFGNTKLS